MTWNLPVTDFHEKYIKVLEMSPAVEAYNQADARKMMLDVVVLEYLRNAKDHAGEIRQSGYAPVEIGIPMEEQHIACVK